MMRVTGAAASALLLFGCAHSSMQFTTAKELEALMRKPRPAKAFADAAIDVPRFELVGPFAEGLEVHETASPWGQLLASSAGGRYTVDGALGCAAREFARFGAAHQGLPSQPIEAFILGRCGSSAPQVRAHSLHGDAPATLSDAELFAQWKGDVQKALMGIEAGDDVGLALARDGDHAWLTILRHRPSAVLVPAVRTVDAEGRILIDGRLTFAAEKVDALINRGKKDWSVCVADPGLALPRFRFVCTATPDDPHAWLSIAGWPPGRLLGKEVARVLVFPKGDRGTVYTASTDVPSGPATVEAFVERVNAVRAADNLPPLQLEAKQSATAAGAAPYFFGRSDGDEADKIALGLMAGWDVEGIITSGSFDAHWTPQPDSGALLVSMLDMPTGRRSLLNPKAAKIAVGMVTEGNATGVLLSTYTVGQQVDPVDAAKQVVALLDLARSKKGKGPSQWLANAPDFYTRSAKALLANEVSANDVAQEFMGDTVKVTHRPVRGLTQTVLELKDVKFADEVLEHPKPQVLVFVGLQRAEGEAWGSYVVIVLLLEGSPGGPQA